MEGEAANLVETERAGGIVCAADSVGVHAKVVLHVADRVFLVVPPRPHICHDRTPLIDDHCVTLVHTSDHLDQPVRRAAQRHRDVGC